MNLYDLRKINQSIIDDCKQNKEKFAKHQLIAKILQDDLCFFNMKIETAYAMLADLSIPKNKIPEVYMELTKPTDL